MIENPVLKGFNPDPSAVLVDNIVYIATSSFLWMPGIRIYQTKDLVNYEHCTDVLTKINLEGHRLDCGIWAPQLSYAKGKFYLVYTIVSSTNRPFKDLSNYLITASNIKGPWSKPVYLNSSGFDPSLFHDNDKCYLLNTIWDYRKKTSNKSDGIILQEFDRKENKLIGKIHHIFKGTSAAKTEASHLYYFDPYYYLVTAEGGTGLEHQVTIARSKNILGPYQLDPNNPILTAKDDSKLLLQCAGHGSIIQFNNKLWMYHLAVRNHLGNPSLLGRETALQPIVLKDGWLRLDSTNNHPLDKIDFNVKPKPSKNYFYQDFKKQLSKNWNTIYTYNLKKWSKKTLEGLLVFGGKSIQSLDNLNMLAIRQVSFDFISEVKFNYNSNHYNQFFGHNLYLNEENYLQFLIYKDDLGKMVGTLHYKIKGASFFADEIITINQTDDHTISFKVKNNIITIMCDGINYQTKIDISYLNGGFTGNFVGFSVHDLNKHHDSFAVIKEFSYTNI